jgi:hypothetical protein
MIGFWRWFWMVSFGLAGVAFVIIAAVVAVRGVGDLRRMFEALRGGGQSK